MSSLRPRVLHIHFGNDGGAERFFASLAQALGDRSVEQRFIIRPNRAWRGEIEGLGQLIEKHYRPLSPFSLLLKKRLRCMVREWRPNAIMAWMPRAARLLPDWPEAVKFTRLGDFPTKLKYFARCDVLVGNSPGISDRCKSLGWAGPVRTITNFPPEVTPQPVNRRELDTPEDAFVISGAARFVPRKGVDLLIPGGGESSTRLAVASRRWARTRHIGSACSRGRNRKPYAVYRLDSRADPPHSRNRCLRNAVAPRTSRKRDS